MKTVHLLNIGYPKCGTTWLWDTLVYNSIFSDSGIKENNNLLIGQSIDEYQQEYIKFNCSANFSTSLIKAERYVIKQLSEISNVKVSIILRNPPELMWSYYNFLNITHTTFNSFCHEIYDQGWFLNYSLIIDRWQTFFKDRFFIFYYEELKDNINFLNNYCKTMGFSATNLQVLAPTNTTNYRNLRRPELDNQMIDNFNRTVYDLQDTTDRNLSQWILT
jgi:hypothetical protein